MMSTSVSAAASAVAPRIVNLQQALREERRRARSLERQLALATAVATIDPLTRVANRGGFDRELARLVASGRSMSLALVDLDDFKQINDTHGHPIGDLALQTVAGWIAAGLRRTDYIARYGGDEFALLLFGARARSIERRLGDMIGKLTERRLTFERDHTTHALQISMSCGVAGYAPGDTPATLLRRADEALYAAKRLGKKRVTAAA
jgi:diguanylate cyclase (GGDEF)-like protein